MLSSACTLLRIIKEVLGGLQIILTFKAVLDGLKGVSWVIFNPTRDKERKILRGSGHCKYMLMSYL